MNIMPNFGMKELYDVSIRLNQPVEFNGKKYETNETILFFEKAEMASISEIKSDKQATGGYGNNVLINWETDKEIDFGIKNGVLSPISWAILSNSKIENIGTKSVAYNEMCQTTEEDEYCYVDLKYCPNHIDNSIWGAQGNPLGKQLPQGRDERLLLKPLPPSLSKYLFCYDAETGEKILDFEVYMNRIFFKTAHRKVYVDYTFNYEDKIKVIEVGNRLFNGFLRLAGKMSLKDEKSGEVSTVILEIPKIKLSSGLTMRLGCDCDTATVSDFFFTGYPLENGRREKQSVCKITFLNKELTGDYI